MNIDFDQQDIIIEIPPEGSDGRSVHPAGAWSADAVYHTLDLVSYQGSSYVALKAVPEGTLPTDAAYWMLSAEKGASGASTWGQIEGNISDQTDLADALDAKADVGASYTKSEADALLADKADSDDVYSKTETDSLLADKADEDDVAASFADVDTALAGKANVGDSYTKSEEDALLSAKADSADVYNKSAMDTALASKANSADVYTKTQTDTMLAEKLDVDPDTTFTGDIITYDARVENAVKNLKVNIEPVQDLHGQSSPYPAGGGKNKLNYDAWKTVGVYNCSVVWENNGVTITATGADCYTNYNSSTFPENARIPVSEGDVVRLFWDTTITGGSIYIFGNASTSSMANATSSSGLVSYTVPSGITYVTFRFGVTTSGNTISYKNIMVTVNDSNSSYAPYSNVCPISGWDEVNVTRTGKNLLPSTDWVKGQYSSGTFYEDNKRQTSPFIKIAPNTTYTMSIDQSGMADLAWINFNYFDESKNWLGDRTVNGDASFSGQRTKTFTIQNSNACYLRLTARAYSDSNKSIENVDILTGTPQLEFGSSASEYEPYSGTQVTIDLGETRYGGTLDVTTGELILDRGFITFDGSNDESWESGTNRYAISVFDANFNLSGRTEVIANEGIFNSGSDVGTIFGATVNGVGKIYFYPPTVVTSLAEFRTWLSSNNLQVVYSIFPLSIQLNPEQISSFLGTNHLWADCGESVLTIRTGAGKLAYQDSLDYDDLTGKPTLGTMSAEDTDDYYDKDGVEALINNSGVVAEKTASGAIATFETNLAENLSALKVAIEPVQDLHGYDNPWPAGGGANQWDEEWESGSISGADGQPVADSTRIRSKNFIKVQESTQYYMFDKNSIRWDIFYYDENQSVLSNTGANASAYFTTPSNCKYIKFRMTTTSLITGDVAINYPASVNTYAPYSNVCPISGWSSAKVTRTGKNLFSVNEFTSTSTARYCNTDGLPMKSGQNYTFSGVMSTSENDRRVIVFLLDSSTINQSTGDPSSYIERFIIQPTNLVRFSQSITPTKDCYFYVKIISANSTLSDIQLELSSSASSYEPYQGQSVTVDLNGTRYGGTLDVLNGVLTVDRVVLKAKDYPNWAATTAYQSNFNATNGIVSIRLGYGAIGYSINTTEWASNDFTSVFPTYQNGGIWNKVDAVGYFGIVDGISLYTTYDAIGLTEWTTDNNTTVNAFKNCSWWNELEFLLRLATPITVTLTPAQMSAIVGLNQVFADTGNVEAGYWCNDTAEAINDVKQMIASVEPTMTATRNYTSGSLIIVASALYKATTNIASGATLAIGTNIVRTTLEEWIVSLLS